MRSARPGWSDAGSGAVAFFRRSLGRFGEKRRAPVQSSLRLAPTHFMFSLTTLARPLLRSTSAAKKVAQNSAKAPSNRRPLKASFAKRNASRDYFRRYCTSHAQASDAPPTIVTVDKLGVQRDASEMQQPQQAKTSYTHGAPAAEMPIFEVTRLNFQETLASQSPVIIMAYMPGYVLRSLLLLHSFCLRGSFEVNFTLPYI